MDQRLHVLRTRLLLSNALLLLGLVQVTWDL